MKNSKQMPAVSEEFIAWLKAQAIPEIFPFSSMTGEDALKQMGYSQGVLFLKALIIQQHKVNQNVPGMKSAITPMG